MADWHWGGVGVGNNAGPACACGTALTGNLALHPRLVDPENGDLHLHPCSPCIDAGSNTAPLLPSHDFEGDPRIVDGDGDTTATVDMGVDELAAPGTCLQLYLTLILRAY
jgi:hypothetical protein